MHKIKILLLNPFIFLLMAILATQFSCRNELDHHRRLWLESGVKNYRMMVDLQKTGHATPNGKFVIIVREGIAKSIQRADNLEVVSENVRFGRYKTLDDIFDYIEQMENREGSWDKREIEYDARFGYPKKVNLDKSNVNDEEICFQVLQFEILE